MVNPVIPNPSPQTTVVMTTDAYAGQRMERNQDVPRPVVDRKQDVPSAREEVPREEVEKAAEKMNRLMGIIDKRLKFEVHEKTHQVMVKVIDEETGEVINEIPPKKLLDMLGSLRELAGLIIDKRV